MTRGADPFSPLSPILSALKRAPLPPLLLVAGDDDWIVAEAARRAVAAFHAAFREGEVASYAGAASVRDAVDDAATVALFATNRLVVLDGSELFRAGKVTAEDVEALLDEAADSGLGRAGAEDARQLTRLARRVRSLAVAAGIGADADRDELARKLAGRVKRAARSGELAALLAFAPEDDEGGEAAAGRLLEYVSRASAGDNTLLVTALSPDREHHAIQALRRAAVTAELTAPDDASRRERLHALGLERALERQAVVEPEVFDTLSERGRLDARPFLTELDRLIDAAPSARVTAEAAARLVLDERKEYGSDFVEAVSARRFREAVGIFERLLGGGEFTAFRPFGAKDEAGARKGPRGEAAFFPLLGLLAADVRRMLALKAAGAEKAGGAGFRRVDYRTFTDRVLPALKTPPPGSPALALEGHPFMLHRAYLASLEWKLPDLVDALLELSAIDRDVKNGSASGPELLTGFLLSRVPPPSRAAAR